MSEKRSNTDEYASNTAKIMHDARIANTWTLRRMGDELGMSYERVRQIEAGEFVSDDTLTRWMMDERQWVRDLAVSMFSTKYNGMLTISRSA